MTVTWIGTNGISTSAAASVLLIMPVAAIVPVFLAGAYHTSTIDGMALLSVYLIGGPIMMPSS